MVNDLPYLVRLAQNFLLVGLGTALAVVAMAACFAAIYFTSKWVEREIQRDRDRRRKRAERLPTPEEFIDGFEAALKKLLDNQPARNRNGG